eukprot:TRINITY_DN8365_c0_g3_i2.p1 TRINITY_DN8365_c0_g3~~TRINITY_DN8365_c0_g3_i2.p1  ORF type:complete len:357 (+),score=55.09 TRINITY_DN8365_c0_g3_i2:705-1775(+)
MASISAYVFPEGGVLWHGLLVLVPSIVLGTLSKTYCKLTYIHRFCQDGQAGQHCALQAKVLRNQEFGEIRACPFTGVKAALVVHHAMKPFFCFVWTLLYAVAFRLLILLTKELPGGLEGWQQRLALSATFFSLFTLEEIGGSRMMALMDDAKGVMSYSSRMVVVFWLVYDTMSESFVNITIVNADRLFRIIFCCIRPLLQLRLFRRFSREYQREVKIMDQMEAQGLHDLDFVAQDSRAMRRLIAVATGLLTNVSVPILTAACACFYTKESGLDLQAGCPGGVFWQILEDTTPGVVIMAFEIAINIYRKKIPLLQYFFFLDPFLIICALVVVYLLVCSVALSSALSLENAFGGRFWR